MTSSRSINKVPQQYLDYSQNLRIYDGGIGVRNGFTSLYEGGQGTNQGGFTLNGQFYQVESGKIYRLNNDNTRTEIVDLGYNERIDVLVYENTRGSFTSLATESVTYTIGSYLDEEYVQYFYYDFDSNTIRAVVRGENGDEDRVSEDIHIESLSTNNSGYALGSVKFLQTGSPTFYSNGSQGGFDDGTGIVCTDLERATPIENTRLLTTLSFDVQVGYYTTTQTAIISANKRNVQVFDGVSLSPVVIDNTGIIEFSAGRSFLASSNVLLASRPITLANPEYAYDFTGSGSYNVTYGSEIKGLKATLGGLYIFTKNKVEYMSAGNSTTGLSYPIGDGGNPINNHLVVAAGEKIFYLTENLEIETVNYISGTSDTQVGKLSNQKIVNIREYLENLDEEQPTAFGYNNRNDNTIQFFVRTIGAQFNDVCIVYDLVNDTWNIDTGKYFNYIIPYNNEYYALSDINASIYQDGVGFTDNGQEIDSLGRTQNMNFGDVRQKIFGGFNVSGGISQLSNIEFTVNIDEESVFNDTLTGNSFINAGIGSSEIGGEPIGGNNVAEITNPFIIEADEGRIWIYGSRIQIEFRGKGTVQNWLIDMLGVRLEQTPVILTDNKF